MELDARSSAILQHVVELFIDGAPAVSSNAVAKRMHGVSPATVRAAMADLESRGLLHQPHTSAGRVPTETGVRSYLDSLGRRRLRSKDRSKLEAAAAGSIADFPASLVRNLSELAGQVSVVAIPRFLAVQVREVGLMRMDARRFVAFFVSAGGLVQQKLVETEIELEPHDLNEAQNFLNEQLRSHSLTEVREIIRRELEGQKSWHESLRRRALTAVAHALPQPAKPEDFNLFVDGASNLVGQPEFADLDRLRELLQCIEDRKALLELLDRVLDAEGVKVMLGSEHDIESLPGVACVGGSFADRAGNSAAVTVLGPPRMNYGRLLPAVEYATRLFGRYLTLV